MFDRRTLSLSLLGLLAASGRSGAGDRAVQGGRSPGVIELFTSQGCSSCPPADALMLDFARAPDIIPLTFPVEIWDYLGWKDTLAKPAFTARQKAYAAMVAGKRVFTPQAVVNGKGSCVGSDLSALARLKSTGAIPSGARLVVEPAVDGWRVTALLPAGATPRLIVMPLSTRREVKIGRGENNGRTMTYANVVRDLRDAGPLENGKAVALARAMVEAPEADGVALLAQNGTLEAPGQILAAAFIEAGGIKA